jgi:hypothetical protein
MHLDVYVFQLLPSIQKNSSAIPKSPNLTESPCRPNRPIGVHDQHIAWLGKVVQAAGHEEGIF